MVAWVPGNGLVPLLSKITQTWQTAKTMQQASRSRKTLFSALETQDRWSIPCAFPASSFGVFLQLGTSEIAA